MSKNENILQIIKQQALAILPNSKVILFGSRATNNYKEDSDYDILIVTQENLPIKIKRQYRNKIRRALLNFEILSDVLVQSVKDVEIKKNLTGHIIKNAIKTGIVL